MGYKYRAKGEMFDEYPLYSNNEYCKEVLKKPNKPNIRERKYDMWIDLCNVNEIDMTQFEKLYAPNDTNKEHPYYIMTCATDKQRDVFLYDGKIQKKKLKLGKQPITFFTIDNSPGNIGLRKVDDITKTINEIYTDKSKDNLNGYGVFNWNYSRDYQGYKNLCTLNPGIGSMTGTGNINDNYSLNLLDVLKNNIESDFTRGIPGVLEKLDIDGERYDFLRCGISELSSFSNGFDAKTMTFKSKDNAYSFYYKIASSSPSQKNKWVGNNFVVSPNTNIFCDEIYEKKPPNGFDAVISGGCQYTNNLLFKGPGVANEGFIPGIYPTGSGAYTDPLKIVINAKNRANVLSFALMYDGVDYWVLVASFFDALTNHTEDRKNDPVDCNYYYMLCKAKDLPDTSVLNEQSSGLQVDLTWNSKFDEFVKAIFGEPKKVGLPDISGPGDKFEDLNNSNGIVGGDVSLDKENNDIKPEDIPPNQGLDDFLLGTKQGALFGFYNLTKDDLEKYTTTLSMLYEKSEGIIFGPINNNVASQIVNNTVSINYLPINIPPKIQSQTTFVVGNTGISNDNNYDEYKWGRNYAQVNYLLSNIVEKTVDLGVIKHNYDNELDFAPYSSASIFIPYLGMQELPINLLQSTSKNVIRLSLSFRFDLMSGDFVCILFRRYENNGSVISEPVCHWNSNCAVNIPVSVIDNSAIIREGAKSLVSTFSMMLGGLGSFSSSISGSNRNQIEPILPNRNNGQITNDNKMPSNYNLSLPSSMPTIDSKQHMIGNSSMSGRVGLLDSQKIILTVERPVLWLPYNYGKIKGYPTYKAGSLSSLRGFFKAPIIRYNGNSGITKDEMASLRNIMSNGVIYDGTNQIEKPQGFSLYTNLSDEIVVRKNLNLLETTTGTFKDDSLSISNPSVTVKLNDNSLNANYIYVSSLKRYYFIVDKKILSNNLIELDLSCDVLTTFFDDIKESLAYVTYSENYGNFYLKDEGLTVQQNTDIYVKRVVDGPFSGSSIIMHCMNTAQMKANPPSQG